MKVRSVLWLALGALSGACAAGAFEREPTPPKSSLILETTASGAPRVAGVILDAETVHPALGAVVVLHCACLRGTREAEVNAQGQYLFSDLGPGTYTIQVLYEQSDIARVFTLEPDQSAKFSAKLSRTAPPRVVT